MHDGLIVALTFSPDGRSLAGARAHDNLDPCTIASLGELARIEAYLDAPGPTSST
jgi:hypothetical protein